MLRLQALGRFGTNCHCSRRDRRKERDLSITGKWDRHRMSRRDFLAISSMGAAALALGTQGVWLPRTGSAQTSSSRPYSWNPATHPFKLGVASGDPELYDNASKASVVLWTRLVPGK